MQEAADQAAAAAKQEKDFWLLLESQDPPLTPQSSWVALRRKVRQEYLAISASDLLLSLCML